MAIHAPITPPSAGAPLSLQYRVSNRAEIEDEIERLIALLDSIEPDPDLEPEEDFCTASDDGCGPVYIHSRVHYDPARDGELVTLPMYGVDQSTGPINQAEAERAFYRAALLGSDEHRPPRRPT